MTAQARASAATSRPTALPGSTRSSTESAGVRGPRLAHQVVAGSQCDDERRDAGDCPARQMLEVEIDDVAPDRDDRHHEDDLKPHAMVREVDAQRLEQLEAQHDE